MIYPDQLYGTIRVSQEEQRLMDTAEFKRIEDISLSAVPVQTLGKTGVASRAEHSLGVLANAQILVEDPQFRPHQKLIKAACLAHDLASPPFSHLSEYFLKEHYGFSHEQYLLQIIHDSAFGDELKRQGVNPDEVAQLVEGDPNHPLSPLINGTIDLDNLDNSLRYCRSMGLLSDSPYHPLAIAAAYTWHNGALALQAESESQLQGWDACRQATYQFVYSDQNLAPAAMVTRALQLAFKAGEIPKEFFRMTDTQALAFLDDCNPTTFSLMTKAKNQDHFQLAFTQKFDHPNPQLKAVLENPGQRAVLSDQLIAALGLKPDQVSVLMGRNRGPKKIHLPLVDQKDQVHYFEGDFSQPFWYFSVYGDKNSLKRITEYAKIVIPWNK